MSSVESSALTVQQRAALAGIKVFFGHQSIGDNLIAGIRDLIAADPELRITLVTSTDPQAVSGPALVEAHIGQNGSPQTKDREFAAIIGKGLGQQGGIAMYKYCYVDINSSTDVSSLFENYRRTVAGLKQAYPRLRIVHITVPLTTVEGAPKAWLKSTLGRTTARDFNAKRNEFNALLRQAFASDPIFDLAALESTYPDGSRSYFTRGRDRIYTLVPEYTSDGGHLNETGRRAAARTFLRFLADLTPVTASVH